MTEVPDSPGGNLMPAPQAKTRRPRPPKIHAPALRAGSTCPRCGLGHLEYDGLLNLSCERCGYSLVGGICT